MLYQKREMIICAGPQNTTLPRIGKKKKKFPKKTDVTEVQFDWYIYWIVKLQFFLKHLDKMCQMHHISTHALCIKH